MNFYGNRPPGKDVYEIHGRFHKNGRWIMADVVNHRPTQDEINECKSLSGFKYMKVEKTI